LALFTGFVGKIDGYQRFAFPSKRPAANVSEVPILGLRWLHALPLAVSPVSIDRGIVPPTTRSAPASRMHSWQAVADLTAGRPIRIALVQVGTPPKAPAHF